MGRIRNALTWLAAAGCLAWVLHDVDAAAFGEGLRGIRWTWVAAGLLFDVLSYVGQGWRWQLLLGGPSTRKATQAVYAGLFTNEVLPLRLGEGVRAWLARRWTGLNLKTVIGSMDTERLFDGVARGRPCLRLPMGRTAARLGGGRSLAGAGCRPRGPRAACAGGANLGLPPLLSFRPSCCWLRLGLCIHCQGLCASTAALEGRADPARGAGRHCHSQCTGQSPPISSSPCWVSLGSASRRPRPLSSVLLYSSCSRFPFGCWALSPSVPPVLA